MRYSDSIMTRAAMHLSEALERGRAGNGVLFCGAGFTADCLGFETPDTLGVSAHLLAQINKRLREKGQPSSFRQVQPASTKFRSVFGDHGLMGLLKDRFSISNVPERMVDIVRFPWSRIYTTNYDNGIELCCGRAQRKYRSINNTQEPEPSTALEVIHLHGFIEKWDAKNFNESCILDVASYARLPSVEKWLQQLRFDLERASVVVFCGFSASDFHINQILFNAHGLREKCFFVNRAMSERDEDAHTIQEEFGTPVYIGLDGFSNQVKAAMASAIPPPLRLASFVEFQAADPGNLLPSVEEIESLFLLGRRKDNQCARDLSLQREDYHVLRDALSWIDEQLNAQGANVILLSGEVCDGKSLVAEDVAQRLSANRPVFWLIQAYDDLLDEVARILERHPDAVMVIENCFELRSERLSMLAKSVEGRDAILLLTARSIAADAETGKVKTLKPLPAFREHRLSSLSDREIEALERLIDQFAGFSRLGGRTAEERRRYIATKCNRSLPTVLLDVLKSENVRARYREQINRLNLGDSAMELAFVASIYAKHIGDPPPLSFISNIFRLDIGSAINLANQGNSAFHMLRVTRGIVETVPAIGASIILREFIDDRQIVSAAVFVLEEMARAGSRSTDYERYIFAQMMRYSRLSTVVESKQEVNRFFDHISKIDYFRREPLFWLQWHMAKAADDKYTDAERLLERGYAEASNWERRRGVAYNRKQLDDRKAKFLMQRARATHRSSADLFRDMRTALEIVGRLLKDKEITHHPFETFVSILTVFEDQGSSLISDHSKIIEASVSSMLLQAKRRLDDVPEGYQQSAAVAATEVATKMCS